MSIIKLEKYKIIFKDKNNYINFAKYSENIKSIKNTNNTKNINHINNMGRNRETFLSYNKMKGA